RTAPISVSAPPWASTLNCFSARTKSPEAQSNSKRNVRCVESAGWSRGYSVSSFAAARTFPSWNSCFAVIAFAMSIGKLGSACCVRYYVPALRDGALHLAALFLIMRELDFLEVEAHRFGWCIAARAGGVVTVDNRALELQVIVSHGFLVEGLLNEELHIVRKPLSTGHVRKQQGRSLVNGFADREIRQTRMSDGFSFRCRVHPGETCTPRKVIDLNGIFHPLDLAGSWDALDLQEHISHLVLSPYTR